MAISIPVGNGFSIRKVPASALGSLAATRQVWEMLDAHGSVVGCIHKTKAQRGHLFGWQAAVGVGVEARPLPGAHYDAEHNGRSLRLAGIEAPSTLDGKLGAIVALKQAVGL